MRFVCEHCGAVVEAGPPKATPKGLALVCTACGGVTYMGSAPVAPLAPTPLRPSQPRTRPQPVRGPSHPALDAIWAERRPRLATFEKADHQKFIDHADQLDALPVAAAAYRAVQADPAASPEEKAAAQVGLDLILQRATVTLAAAQAPRSSTAAPYRRWAPYLYLVALAAGIILLSRVVSSFTDSMQRMISP
jgi:hypothetical protein